FERRGWRGQRAGSPGNWTTLMPAFILDTNQLSAAINPVSPIRERLHRARRGGARLGTCIPVLCELEIAIQQGKRADSYRRQLQHLLKQIRVWPLERDIPRLYA